MINRRGFQLSLDSLGLRRMVSFWPCLEGSLKSWRLNRLAARPELAEEQVVKPYVFVWFNFNRLKIRQVAVCAIPLLETDHPLSYVVQPVATARFLFLIHSLQDPA